ncbi:hypothetical protein Tco_1446698 [Tanacetum coccineum]
MKDVFVSVENDLDETFKQNELLKDQLLEASLAEDIKNLVITSYVKIKNKDLHNETEIISKESKDVSNESKIADTVCNDAFEVTQVLSQRIVELEKDLQKFEERSIAFENHNFTQASGEKHNLFENKTSVFQIKIDELEKSLAKQTKENSDLLMKIDNLENVFANEEKRTTLGKLNAFDKENCDFESKITHLEKIIAQKSKDFDDVKLELTQLENLKGKRVETKLDNSILGKPPLLNNERDQLLKQIAFLKSKLASKDIRSCQKEYHELRTSYNALKVKFDSLNRKK